jgi:hypothetical protein
MNCFSMVFIVFVESSEKFRKVQKSSENQAQKSSEKCRTKWEALFLF